MFSITWEGKTVEYQEISFLVFSNMEVYTSEFRR